MGTAAVGHPWSCSHTCGASEALELGRLPQGDAGQGLCPTEPHGSTSATPGIRAGAAPDTALEVQAGEGRKTLLSPNSPLQAGRVRASLWQPASWSKAPGHPPVLPHAQWALPLPSALFHLFPPQACPRSQRTPGRSCTVVCGGDVAEAKPSRVCPGTCKGQQGQPGTLPSIPAQADPACPFPCSASHSPWLQTACPSDPGLLWGPHSPSRSSTCAPWRTWQGGGQA